MLFTYDKARLVISEKPTGQTERLTMVNAGEIWFPRVGRASTRAPEP
jgi:hypothetical protein